LIIILSIFIISNYGADAQGFNWQYSARLPFAYPYLFAGLTGNVDYNFHNSNLRLTEDNLDCCGFGSGRGNGGGIGLAAEYWVNGLTAINLQLALKQYSGDFIADGQKLPFTVFDNTGSIIGRDTVSFRNEMVTELRYVSLEAGGKWRLFKSHFFAGASINAGYLIASDVEIEEYVVSPDYWVYTDGSRRRSLGNYSITEVKTFSIMPKLNFGYNIAIIPGMYIAPQIEAGLPLLNIASNGDWSMLSVSFKITLLQSIANK